jgi:transketolase
VRRSGSDSTTTSRATKAATTSSPWERAALRVCQADKFAAALPDQFFQLGIAEQNLVGVAAGLASVGFVPWTSSFTVFLTHRAADQVRMLVAQTGANIKIAASYSGLLTGYTGRTHQDVEDLAIMRAMPGMRVLAPADEQELVSMMDSATAMTGPVYLRLARDQVADVFDSNYSFQLGMVHQLRTGEDRCWSPPAPRPSAPCRPRSYWPPTALPRGSCTCRASSRSTPTG